MLVGDVYNVSRLVGLVKDRKCPVVDFPSASHLVGLFFLVSMGTGSGSFAFDVFKMCEVAWLYFLSHGSS